MIRFITFEGGDGTGKSTQLKALGLYLASRGISYHSTREPGGTPLGRFIRKVLLESGDQCIDRFTEIFLYLADRAQHVHDVILPNLRSSKIVLCDRYVDSTLAYQGYGRGVELGVLHELNRIATGDLRPDLTFLFDCPVEMGLSRAAKRLATQKASTGREDRFETEDIEFHRRVRNGFLALAQAEPERFRILDASRPAAEVTQEMKSIIDRELA